MTLEVVRPPILRMPPEIQLHFLSYVPINDLLTNISAVCREWRALANDYSHFLAFARKIGLKATPLDIVVQFRELFEVVLKAKNIFPQKFFDSRSLFDSFFQLRELVKNDPTVGPKLLAFKNHPTSKKVERLVLLQHPFSVDQLNSAVERGTPHTVKQIIDIGITPVPLMLIKAARKGNTRVVKLLLRLGIRPEEIRKDDFKEAVAKGKIEMLRTLVAAGYRPRKEDLNLALREGAADVVQQFIKNRWVQLRQSHLEIVIKERGKGKKLILALLINSSQEMKSNLKPRLLQIAIEANRPDIVQMLINFGLVPNREMINLAKILNQLTIVEILLDNGVKPVQSDLDYLIEQGATDMIAKVLAKGLVPTRQKLQRAISICPKAITPLINAGIKVLPEDLLMAIDRCSEESVQALLSADVMQVLPCHIKLAKKKGSVKVLELLETHHSIVQEKTPALVHLNPQPNFTVYDAVVRIS